MSVIGDWIRRIFGREPIGVWIPDRIGIEATRTMLREKKMRELAYRLIELKKKLAHQQKLLGNISPEDEERDRNTQLQFAKSLRDNIKRIEKEMEKIMREIESHDKEMQGLIHRMIEEDAKKS